MNFLALLVICLSDKLDDEMDPYECLYSNVLEEINPMLISYSSKLKVLVKNPLGFLCSNWFLHWHSLYQYQWLNPWICFYSSITFNFLITTWWNKQQIGKILHIIKLTIFSSLKALRQPLLINTICFLVCIILVTWCQI